MNILVAGASGYIGTELIPALRRIDPDAKIFALSRTVRPKEDQVEWRSADLFSLKSLEEALPDRVDVAIYLVHSMGPTAQLDQGSFADYDLILADNFSRSLQKHNVKQIIYLGGLVPQGGNLSEHLESRLEVEGVFKEYNYPLTVFRAGLIIGERGSSFQILLKLVKRLPIIICPRWTQTLNTPVDLETVLYSICDSVGKTDHLHKVYDLASTQALSYLDMMRETALALKKRSYFFTVPFFTPFLSRSWVCLITNSPKNLVYPLIESLAHPMIARPDHRYNPSTVYGTYASLLEKMSLKTLPGSSLFRFKARLGTVRSVQRLPLAQGLSAEWVRRAYVKWLPTFLSPFVKADIHGPTISFCFLRKKWVLLRLEFSEARSTRNRQLLYIRDGLLVKENNRGRLEFREVLGGKYVIAAIHDFSPSLPWYFYKWTQAIVHLWVMKAFAKYLDLVKRRH